MRLIMLLLAAVMWLSGAGTGIGADKMKLPSEEEAEKTGSLPDSSAFDEKERPEEEELEGMELPELLIFDADAQENGTDPGPSSELPSDTGEHQGQDAAQGEASGDGRPGEGETASPAGENRSEGIGEFSLPEIFD